MKKQKKRTAAGKKAPMTFEEYEQSTERNLIKPGISPYLAYQLYLQNGLSEEVGELAGLTKKACRDLNGIITEKMKRRMVKELGDQLWYITRIAKHLGYTLVDAARFNADKLSVRIKRGSVSGRSDDHR